MGDVPRSLLQSRECLDSGRPVANNCNSLAYAIQVFVPYKTLVSDETDVRTTLTNGRYERPVLETCQGLG